MAYELPEDIENYVKHLEKEKADLKKRIKQFEDEDDERELLLFEQNDEIKKLKSANDKKDWELKRLKEERQKAEEEEEEMLRRSAQIVPKQFRGFTKQSPRSSLVSPSRCPEPSQPKTAPNVFHSIIGPAIKSLPLINDHFYGERDSGTGSMYDELDSGSRSSITSVTGDKLEQYNEQRDETVQSKSLKEELDEVEQYNEQPEEKVQPKLEQYNEQPEEKVQPKLEQYNQQPEEKVQPKLEQYNQQQEGNVQSKPLQKELEQYNQQPEETVQCNNDSISAAAVVPCTAPSSPPLLRLPSLPFLFCLLVLFLLFVLMPSMHDGSLVLRLPVPFRVIWSRERIALAPDGRMTVLDVVGSDYSF